MGSEVKVVKSVCRMCHGGCGVLIHVKDGEVVKVEGDPESPISHGTLCGKGLASAQLVHNPVRLKRPLKGIGERGEGRFQRIGWSEALGIGLTNLENRFISRFMLWIDDLLGFGEHKPAEKHAEITRHRGNHLASVTRLIS